MVGKRVSIYEKALLDALFLTHWNLAVPHQTSVKNKATMTSMGMVYMFNNVYSYRRGLRRCSFRLKGDARATMRETSDRTDSHALFCI